LTTVIAALLPAASSAAGMTAVNCVGLTKVVVMGIALKSAVDVLTKLVPVRVMVVLGLPAGTDVMLRLTKVGAGLLMAKA